MSREKARRHDWKMAFAFCKRVKGNGTILILFGIYNQRESCHFDWRWKIAWLSSLFACLHRKVFLCWWSEGKYKKDMMERGRKNTAFVSTLYSATGISKQYCCFSELFSCVCEVSLCVTAMHRLWQLQIQIISLLFCNFFSSAWLQSVGWFFQPPYLWDGTISVCFLEGVGRLRIFLFLTCPKSKGSRRFSLTQFGEGGVKGSSIRGSVKCWILVRIFSELASVDLSGNPVSGKENEAETPSPQLDRLWWIYFILFISCSFLMAVFPHLCCQHLEAFWKELGDVMRPAVN